MRVTEISLHGIVPPFCWPALNAAPYWGFNQRPVNGSRKKNGAYVLVCDVPSFLYLEAFSL
jgi:hypothetical protein